MNKLLKLTFLSMAILALSKATAKNRDLGTHTTNTNDLFKAYKPSNPNDMLADAINTNNITEAQEAINLGANVNTPAGTGTIRPLAAAKFSGNKDMIKLLINAGAN